MHDLKFAFTHQALQLEKRQQIFGEVYITDQRDNLYKIDRARFCPFLRIVVRPLCQSMGKSGSKTRLI